MRTLSIVTRRGQSTLEYAILFSAMIVTAVVMQPYLKRAIQGRWKASADQVGDQFTTGQFHTVETRQHGFRAESTGTTGTISPTGEGAVKAWSRSDLKNFGDDSSKLTAAEIGKLGGKIATDYYNS